MAATASTMLELGTKAPDFSLQDLDGNRVTLKNYKDAKALLVIFMCNHCPFVQHIIDSLAKTAQEYQAKGVAVLGINSNDVTAYPEDAPEYMKEFRQQHNITFPYLFDESQEVAKRYKAACTPDIFLFNKERYLVYRGQYDNSRPGNQEPVTGRDLRSALDALVFNKPLPEQQRPSIGCNIKWKPGNEPGYS
jgi:peroxiredoxin